MKIYTFSKKWYIVNRIDFNFRNNSNNTKLKSYTKFYDSLYNKLLNGNLLYDALNKTNYKLDNIFLSLISVSEETGKLADVLNNLSKYYEDKINISSKIKSSMSYPILLSTFLIIMFNLCILVLYLVILIHFNHKFPIYQI